jgi:hypothetical protein
MRLAVCTIVKNEADSIAEHIVYHRLLGFDTTIVLDHGSVDDTAGAARQQRGTIVIPWHSSQLAGYAAVCRSYAGQFDWVAFIDADEYIAVAPGANLRDRLAAMEGVGAVAAPWLIFGSNAHDRKPSGLTISAFTKRANNNHPANRHCKSIVRPELVLDWGNPHGPMTTGQMTLPNGTSPVWELPGVLPEPLPDPGWLRVHHYHTRSREHWQERMLRGQHSTVIKTWDDFASYDCNEVVDLTAARAALDVGMMLDFDRWHDTIPPASKADWEVR